MEIKNLENLRQAEQQKTSRKSLDREALAKIWLVMSGMFGTKWTNPYGEWNDSNPTIAIWGAALRGLTMEQVLYGLDAIANSGTKFAPVASEFKEFCLGPKEHWEHTRMRKADEDYEQLRLEHKKINKDVGKKYLGQWRDGCKKS